MLRTEARITFQLMGRVASMLLGHCEKQVVSSLFKQREEKREKNSQRIWALPKNCREVVLVGEMLVVFNRIQRERETGRVCARVCVHVCMHVCACVCARARVCVCKGGRGGVYVCAYVCTYECVYVWERGR
jgi:hypothetical protein